MSTFPAQSALQLPSEADQTRVFFAEPSQQPLLGCRSASVRINKHCPDWPRAALPARWSQGVAVSPLRLLSLSRSLGLALQHIPPLVTLLAAGKGRRDWGISDALFSPMPVSFPPQNSFVLVNTKTDVKPGFSCTINKSVVNNFFFCLPFFQITFETYLSYPCVKIYRTNLVFLYNNSTKGVIFHVNEIFGKWNKCVM